MLKYFRQEYGLEEGPKIRARSWAELMSTMARTESHRRSRPEVKTLRYGDAILKAKSWSEFQSNLGDNGNNSKRIRVVIIYKNTRNQANRLCVQHLI